MATPNNNDPRVQGASDKQNATAKEYLSKSREERKAAVERAVAQAIAAEGKS